MKTQIFKLILLVYLGGFMALQGQNLFDLAPIYNNSEGAQLKWADGSDMTEAEFQDILNKGTGWSDYTIGGSVGYGFSSSDGNNDSSFCAGFEAAMKIIGEDINPCGAGYLGLFGNYHSVSGENYDENTLRFGPKFTFFDPIAAFNRVQLTYGVNAYYETGNQKFSGFEENITGYGANITTGLSVRINNKVSVGVEFPVVSYLNRTYEANGIEFKEDRFSGAINKDNPAMASVRFNIGQSLKFGGKDTDGDGIYDRDDDCPEMPGEPENNGCPDANDR